MHAASAALVVAYAASLLLLGGCLSCLPCALCLCRRDALRCGTVNKWCVSLLLVCASWLAPTALWFGYSPLNACERRVVYSYPHPSSPRGGGGGSGGGSGDGGVWTPFWCARRCVGSRVVRPRNVSHLRALVAGHASVRALGGGHSSTDLQCDGALLLPVHDDAFCTYGGVEEERQPDGERVAAFGAGCTVEYALRALLREGYQLEGFGGIAQQRLGGAISTSLHGQHTTSFASHVREVTAVVANGSVVTVRDRDEVRAWTGSMGRLGVVVSMKLRVHPLQRVACTTTHDASAAALGAALSDPSLSGFEAKRLLLPSSPSSSPSPYVLRTCVDAAAGGNASAARNEEGYEDKDSLAAAFAVDNVALPLVMLLGTTLTGWDAFASLMFRASGVGSSRPSAPLAVNDYRVPVSYNPHWDEEYAVPAPQCHAALEDVRALAASLGLRVHAFLRRVDADGAWLSWAPTRSCAVRLEYYDYNRVDLVEFERQFRLRVERIVVARGGGGHRGKPWYGTAESLLRHAPRRADFEAYRRRVDPSSKFENAFTAEMAGGEARTRAGLPADLQVRAFVWRLSVWFAVGVSAFVAVFLCALGGRRIALPRLGGGVVVVQEASGGRRPLPPPPAPAPAGASAAAEAPPPLPPPSARKGERDKARARK